MTMPSSPPLILAEVHKRFRFAGEVPAASLFSVLFALDGDLRWIGLLGVVPLLFAFHKGCPTCSLRHTRHTDAWPTWPRH